MFYRIEHIPDVTIIYIYKLHLIGFFCQQINVVITRTTLCMSIIKHLMIFLLRSMISYIIFTLHRMR